MKDFVIQHDGYYGAACITNLIIKLKVIKSIKLMNGKPNYTIYKGSDFQDIKLLYIYFLIDTFIRYVEFCF